MDEPTPPARLGPWSAGALVFGSSGAVLVVELASLRLLAPYLGLTLETNTLVIGLASGGDRRGRLGRRAGRRPVAAAPAARAAAGRRRRRGGADAGRGPAGRRHRGARAAVLGRGAGDRRAGARCWRR